MTETTEPTPNLPLLRKVWDQINVHPETYRQADWLTSTKIGDLTLQDAVLYGWEGEEAAAVTEANRRWRQAVTETGFCGTAACFAGHAALLEGWEPVMLGSGGISGTVRKDGQLGYVREVARQALGLTNLEASRLFRGSSTLDDVHQVLQEIFARAGDRL